MAIDLSQVLAKAELLENAGKDLEDAAAEINEWRSCALYDAKMEGPQFKGWDRSALDRCRKKFIEGNK